MSEQTQTLIIYSSACMCIQIDTVKLRYINTSIKQQKPEGTRSIVTAMCPVPPSATAVKVKSKDQVHRRAAIKVPFTHQAEKIIVQKTSSSRDRFITLSDPTCTEEL